MWGEAYRVGVSGYAGRVMGLLKCGGMSFCDGGSKVGDGAGCKVQVSLCGRTPACTSSLKLMACTTDMGISGKGDTMILAMTCRTTRS